MPIYEHKCEACNHIWEDWFSSYKTPIPDECPECKVKGKIIRLVSWCSGKVELTGRELVQSLRADGKKLSKEARNNENLAANLVGEGKYHNNSFGTK